MNAERDRNFPTIFAPSEAVGSAALQWLLEHGADQNRGSREERGADLSIRAKLPGHYERPEEVVDCTPVEYARLFPEKNDGETLALLLAKQKGNITGN